MTKAILQDKRQDDSATESGLKKSKTAAEKPRAGVVLEIPGAEPGVWDRWSCPEGGMPVRLVPEDQTPAKFRRVLALPSGSIFCWPLWISPEGDPLELVRLELSGRHLLKRGMEESLKVLPLDSTSEKRLVLALAPEEPLPEEKLPAGWKEADSFLLPGRLKAPQGESDLLFWKEHGVLRGAFFRKDNPVWCFPADRGGVAVLLRAATMRLLSEGILTSQPARIGFSGISREEVSALRSTLQSLYPRALLSYPQEESLPSLPAGEVLFREDVLPSEARRSRERAKNRERFTAVAAVAAVFYVLVILWGAGDLIIRHSALSKLRGELAAMEAPATKARKVSERWNALKSAIDPSTYALDQLAAIAAPTSGGKVRLISVTMENDHLQISGEATDVTQAYGFIEALKKSPILQQYDWTSGQPQLAGKNSVKFEMEGARVHANP